MRKRIAYTLALVLLLLLAFGIGYRSGFSRGSSDNRIFVERDASDLQNGSAQAGYEPYFNKQNTIPDKLR